MNLLQFAYWHLVIASFTFAEEFDECSYSLYGPTPITCFNSSSCIVPSDRCGDYCYSPLAYTCESEQLHPLRILDKPYGLYAAGMDNNSWSGPGIVINACNGGFFIGRSTCTWCPSDELPDLCGSFENITALSGGAGMQATVPGGQQFYINPIGTLSFTQAHSAIIPGDSIVGKIQAFEDGGFVYADGGGWYACPMSKKGVYQIVNNLKGVVLDEACGGVAIYTQVLDGGPFAWQYE